jgi:hypothetical protein
LLPPELTNIPDTIGVVVLVLCKSYILLLYIDEFKPPVIWIPLTAVVNPEDERPLIILFVINILGEVFEHPSPKTTPPPFKLFIVFEETVNGLAVFPDDVIVIPV